jgi:hydroxypyruvate isomerase
MRLSANLSFLFAEFPFLDRFEAAARAGFRGVEFMFPYDFPVEAIAERLDRYDLELVLFNLPAGDWAAGERGIAAIPGREAEFRDGVGRAIDYARRLGVRRVNALAGLVPPGTGDAAMAASLAANLREAAPRLDAEGIRLLVEPINSRIDMPGFWLDTIDRALATIRQVGHPNLGLQFDVYHAAVMGEDPAARLDAVLPAVGHVQIADHPGRHEPGTGRIDCVRVFELLDARGYEGWVGCEYRPVSSATAGLDWARPWLQARPGLA